MPSSLQPMLHKDTNAVSVPQLSLPRKIAARRIHSFIDVERNLLPFIIQAIGWGSSSMMMTQMMTTYLSSHGDGPRYAGYALSVSKFSDFTIAMLNAAFLTRIGILNSIYIQFSFGIAGCLLFVAAFWLQAPNLTVFAFVPLGFFSSTALSTMTYIRLNVPHRKQAVFYLNFEIKVFAGIICAPVIMSLCTTQALQVCVPFILLASLTAVSLVMMVCRHGLDSSNFSKSFGVAASVDKHPHSGGARLLFITACFLFGNVSNLLANNLFSTLASIVCQDFYGWKASDMGKLTLPTQLAGIACLVCLPALINKIGLVALIWLGLSLVMIGLVIESIFVDELSFVVGYCMKSFSDKLMSVVPNVVLSTCVSPEYFPKLIEMTSVVDGLLGALLPTILLTAYDDHPLSPQALASFSLVLKAADSGIYALLLAYIPVLSATF